MKDLNVRQETIKILEKNTGSNLFDLGQSNFLLDRSSEARETKAKINYWDFTKVNMLYKVTETINKTKSQPMEGKRILANDRSVKGLVPKIYLRICQTQHPKNK